jgi:hypothetical protein
MVEQVQSPEFKPQYHQRKRDSIGKNNGAMLPKPSPFRSTHKVKVLRFSAEKKGKYVYNTSFLFCL